MNAGLSGHQLVKEGAEDVLELDLHSSRNSGLSLHTFKDIDYLMLDHDTGIIDRKALHHRVAEIWHDCASCVRKKPFNKRLG